MATAAPRSPETGTRLALQFTIAVGAADWTIRLTDDALALLGGDPLDSEAVERVMANVRAKAVRLHWYGGGAMTIDADELSLAAPPPPLDADGSALPRPARYRIVAPPGAVPARPSLRAVA